MSLDFRVDVGFFEHPKTLRLETSLGKLAPSHLLRLWAWARINKPKGDLSGMTDDEIGTAARWRRPPEFCAELVRIGWLDGTEGSRLLHGWEEHNGYAAHEAERKGRARAAADARWSKVDAGRNANGNAGRIRNALPKRKNSNAPSPSPTPSPSPQRGGVGRAHTPAREAAGGATPDTDATREAVRLAENCGVHERRARDLVAQLGHERVVAAARGAGIGPEAQTRFLDALKEHA